MKVTDANIINIEETKKWLNDWNIIIMPTDTCLWFSGFYNSKKAIQNIQNIKNRGDKKPFSLLFESIEQAKKYCIINKNQENFMINNKYQSSFVLKKNEILKNYFEEFETVSIRIENDEYLFKGSSIFKTPLITTSVNISWEKILESKNDILNQFWKISIIEFLYFDTFKPKNASSIWDLSWETYKKIR